MKELVIFKDRSGKMVNVNIEFNIQTENMGEKIENFMKRAKGFLKYVSKDSHHFDTGIRIPEQLLMFCTIEAKSKDGDLLGFSSCKVERAPIKKDGKSYKDAVKISTHTVFTLPKIQPGLELKTEQKGLDIKVLEIASKDEFETIGGRGLRELESSISETPLSLGTYLYVKCVQETIKAMEKTMPEECNHLYCYDVTNPTSAHITTKKFPEEERYIEIGHRLKKNGDKCLIRVVRFVESGISNWK